MMLSFSALTLSWLVVVLFGTGVDAFASVRQHSMSSNRMRPVAKTYAGSSTTEAERSTTEEPSRTTTVVRPDPSTLISAKDDTTQRLAFGVISISLAFGTTITVQALGFLHSVFPGGWFEVARDFTWPVSLGLIYLVIGVAHFVVREFFEAIVPPRGTWGNLWQVPAPGAKKFGLSYGDYHSYWSGIAEIGGGLMLIAGGLGALPVQIPAFLLFLLTICVTPANIYMATHDIQPPRFPPIQYPQAHYARGVLQCVLLALFWILAFQ